MCIRGYFFKGFSTTRVKKKLPSASAVILFFQEIFRHFWKIDEEDRRFRPNLRFLWKIFLRQNQPLGVVLSPKYAKVEVKNLSKNSSTAPTITLFILKRRQTNHIHDLPWQLCRKWPIFAVKGTYTGVYRRISFKGVSTTRLFSKCFLAEMRKKIRPGLPR